MIGFLFAKADVTTLESDYSIFYIEKNLYNAKGRVKVTKGTDQMTAEEIICYLTSEKKIKNLKAMGNVVVSLLDYKARIFSNLIFSDLKAVRSPHETKVEIENQKYVFTGKKLQYKDGKISIMENAQAEIVV